jgi:hypothetical protein
MKAKTLEYCERFLGLCKDTDPGLPEFGDSRKGLGGLKEMESEE